MNALDLLYLPIALATAPAWATKKREGWRERFGHVQALANIDRPRVLLHAVSVGEVNALRELVPLLTKDMDVVVSATTDTGLARAREIYSTQATVVRYPLDFSWSVRRFLDAVRPSVVALTELEVWPNFVAECQRREIPVGVINGRLSARSFRGYRKIRRLIAPTFARLAFAAVQDEDYAERFRTMGVVPGRCTVTGSMKWDTAKIRDHVEGADQLARELGIDRTKPLVVAGSTGPLETGPHANEEALLHAACPPEVQLLCAPRKPERFDEAARALPNCVRRSVTKGSPVPPGATRFLLDTIGELGKAYALADLVVVGRSFGNLHGSDPVEPIGLGKATLIGQRFGDFEFAVASLQNAGGLKVVSADQLGDVIRRLLSDPSARQDLARAGRACITRHQGASVRHADLIRRMFEGKAIGPDEVVGVRQGQVLSGTGP
ncbi:MAG: hypothetical protein IPK69_12755 [Phycisphaerales bacterium]|nr:MAG: hypothetical protein IPK69_12755 [Phycisphaerales bacterium]